MRGSACGPMLEAKGWHRINGHGGILLPETINELRRSELLELRIPASRERRSMKYRHTALTTILGLLIAFGWGIPSWSAQQASSGTGPVSTVVSVEPRHAKDIQLINP